MESTPFFLQGNYSFGDMSTVRARARWAILADFLKEKSFQDYLGFWLGNITEQVILVTSLSVIGMEFHGTESFLTLLTLYHHR